MLNKTASQSLFGTQVQHWVCGLVILGSIPAFSGEKARPPVTIGNGSGHLRYPDAQTTLKLQPGDTLCIRPGIYSGTSRRHHQRGHRAGQDIFRLVQPASL